MFRVQKKPRSHVVAKLRYRPCPWKIVREAALSCDFRIERMEGRSGVSVSRVLWTERPMPMDE